MRTMIISFTIFICLLGFVVYADHTLKDLCDKTIDSCDEILVELNNDNWTNAEANSKKILNTLNNSSFISSIYINHTDYDILYNEALRLSSYIKQNDASESFTSARLLKSYSYNIKHLHKLDVKNII